MSSCLFFLTIAVGLFLMVAMTAGEDVPSAGGVKNGTNESNSIPIPALSKESVLKFLDGLIEKLEKLKKLIDPA